MKYIVFHIERTGGTTLRHILFNHYGWHSGAVYPHYGVFEGKTMPPFTLNEEVAKSKFIMGHLVRYGIHEMFDEPCYYILFLRDPYARMQSWYNHARVSDVKAGSSIRDFETWFDFFKTRPEFSSFVSPPSLQAAKESLHQMSFIGFQESLSEDMHQLLPSYKYIDAIDKDNSTQKLIDSVGIEAVSFTEEQAERVREVLKEDYEFVNYARELRKNGLNKGFTLSL